MNPHSSVSIGITLTQQGNRGSIGITTTRKGKEHAQGVGEERRVDIADLRTPRRTTTCAVWPPRQHTHTGTKRHTKRHTKTHTKRHTKTHTKRHTDLHTHRQPPTQRKTPHARAPQETDKPRKTERKKEREGMWSSRNSMLCTCILVRTIQTTAVEYYGRRRVV